ncbi:MAG: hypothetical protein RLZZ422_2085 [Pseudomonadota bacterium]|jgi:CRISPR-associated protein (TIGR02584 family)
MSPDYPRRILLFVAAYSPQIITETLYALTCQTNEPWLPTEIHVITTLKGAAVIQQQLMSTPHNWLSRFCQDYQLPTLTLQPEHLHLITDTQGQALDDIRTSEDNAYAADFIMHCVRDLTADESSSLHASLSGGRRTMTYYMGYALSLFGRPQDRLTHVLVEDEYICHQGFYYPPPYSQSLTKASGEVVDATKIQITLADIPFLRLRGELPSEVMQSQKSFMDIIRATQVRFDPPKVEVCLRRAQIYCGGVLIEFTPVQAAFYTWMLQRRKNDQTPIHWSTSEVPDLATQFLKVYELLFEHNNYYETVAKALKDGITKSWFEERKSNTNKAIITALGKTKAQPYLIQAQGKRPKTCFGIVLLIEAIELGA